MDISIQPRFSVLDLCPWVSGSNASETLQKATDLAQLVEKLNYHRYWVAEHHDMPGIASSAPEIIIGHVAQATKKIRVGSGGIMLPNHAPLKMAENFRTLEAFHPGRIDLGLGRAPGTDMKAALALRGAREKLRADDFPETLTELMSYLSDQSTNGIIAMPQNLPVPPIWILGSSDFGARLAAERGLPFAFAQHFSGLPAKEVVELYRHFFQPSPFLKKPQVLVASHVICADTDEEAFELSKSSDFTFLKMRQTGKSEPLASPAELDALGFSQAEWTQIREAGRAKFVGSRARIQEELQKFIEDVQMDELMITTMVYDHQARRHSYEMLSQMFGLSQHASLDIDWKGDYRRSFRSDEGRPVNPG